MPDMDPELLYQLALTMVPNIGTVQAKILLQHCNAEEIFHAKRSHLEKIEGIGPLRAKSIKTFTDFSVAEQEMKFIERYKIRPLFITNDDYPKRLLNCYDSPTILFFKGNTNLNASKVVAVIGTRSNTYYGRQLTETLIHDLAAQHVLVISGLAFGIDAIAHKAAVENDLATVGVLAHGLDQLYPGEHAGLAREMINNGGGLLTEFRSYTKPDKHNFPNRNRIVAGMSDATIVVETGLKGGSMITAELANSYNKDVFAFPGKTTDAKSAGCNFLIRNNKAMLLTNATELLQVMQWEETIRRKEQHQQRELFIELSPSEKIIVDILKEKDTTHIDEINARAGLSASSIAAAILNLELQAVIIAKPGKLYSLG